MPTYVYRCKECSHEFEEVQKIKDPPLTICPECKGEIHRVILANRFILKGGGWSSNENKFKHHE